ncbi:MAG: hypothetical protein V4733_01940 [Verrucomicrobiota bacterium]
MPAFPMLQQELAAQLREARLDHAAFGMQLKICRLADCRAACCHDGVFLDAEEREVIGNLVVSRAETLETYGWHAEEIFENGSGRWKSVTLPDHGVNADFPAHFSKTRCVFLDAEHRCVLQRLAADEGKHPWFWKPISCWMHPLLLKPGTRGGRPLLTLATPENDTARVFLPHTLRHVLPRRSARSRDVGGGAGIARRNFRSEHPWGNQCVLQGAAGRISLLRRLMPSSARVL